MDPAASTSKDQNVNAGSLIQQDVNDIRSRNSRDSHSDIESGADNDNRHEEEDSKAPPDGGYGWINVICIFFQNSVTWGLNSTFGVYLSFYLENDYFPEAKMIHYAIIGGLSAAVGMLSGPMSNYITTRWHYKVSMVIGALFLSLGQILAGFSTRIWQLFLTQGVMFGFGLGFLFVPASPILQQWFLKRRALAAGIQSTGSGFGALIYSTTTRVAIEKHSLRFALITNGLVSFCVLMPVIYLYKDRVKIIDAKFRPFQASLLKKPPFVLIIFWGVFSIIGYFISLFTLSTFAVDGLGLPQSYGSTVTSVLAAGQIVGRPILGLLLDYAGRINMASLSTLLAGFSCLFIWLFTHNYPILVFFAFVNGCFGGIFWGSAAPVTAEVVGIQHLGSALSVLWLSVAVPITFSQVISLELLEYSRTYLGRDNEYAYHISIGFSGGAFVLSSLLALWCKFSVQKNFKLFEKT